jgi:hypothetical protein
MYHYEWNLYWVKDFVPYDSIDVLRRELIEHGISTAAMMSAICRSCLDDVLAQLGLPSMDTQLQRRGYGEPMNEDEPISFQMYRSIIERASGNDPMKGACGWCGGVFGWNASGESIWYDIHSVSSPTGEREGFRLCEACGERFAFLFEIKD